MALRAVRRNQFGADTNKSDAPRRGEQALVRPYPDKDFCVAGGTS
jgi:hypothetical protein